MKEDFVVQGFTALPHPKGIVLNGKTVRLEPLNVEKHSEDLFESNSLDIEGLNWRYLRYGTFETLETFQKWLTDEATNDDPSFLSIVRLSDNKAVGVASFLRINPN